MKVTKLENEFVAPSPAAAYAENDPVFKYAFSSPTFTHAAPAQRTEYASVYAAPVPAIASACVAPVIECVTPAPAATHAAPTPVIEHVTPALLSFIQGLLQGPSVRRLHLLPPRQRRPRRSNTWHLHLPRPMQRLLLPLAGNCAATATEDESTSLADAYAAPTLLLLLAPEQLQ